MRVRGNQISVDNALEIIRRTDLFFVYGCGGNDRQYVRRVRDAVGMPQELESIGPESMGSYNTYRKKMDAWRQAWGVVETEYVTNQWVSTALIYGPSGWCHPDGKISFDYNVGKWPSSDEILGDWKKIAEAFPFLDLGVTLMDREHSEEGAIPVVSFRVRNGSVEAVNPDVTTEYQDSGVCAPSFDQAVLRLVLGGSGERGLPWEVIEKWARRAKK